MSLRHFHILFISVSTLLLLGFAAWVFLVAAAEPGLNALGALSAVAAVGLLIYLVWFIRKSRRLP